MTRSSNRFVLILVALITVALLVAAGVALRTEPEDPTTPTLTEAPDPASQGYDRDRLVPPGHPDVATGDGVEDLPETYVGRADSSAREAPDTRSPAASEAAPNPGLQARADAPPADLGEKPAADVPEADTGASVKAGALPDGTFRDAVKAWTGPEQCAKQVRGDGGSTVRVRIDFSRTGQARALAAVGANTAQQRRYVDCLESRLVSLDLERALTEPSSREATLLF